MHSFEARTALSDPGYGQSFAMPVYAPAYGMTLRDYFAAVALQAHYAKQGGEYYNKVHAEMAYELADAMLEAREQK